MTAPATTHTLHDDRYTIERTLGETPCGPVLLATQRTVAPDLAPVAGGEV